MFEIKRALASLAFSMAFDAGELAFDLFELFAFHRIRMQTNLTLYHSVYFKVQNLYNKHKFRNNSSLRVVT